MFDEVFVNCPRCKTERAGSIQIKPGGGQSYDLWTAPKAVQADMVENKCSTICKKCAATITIDGSIEVCLRVEATS